MYYVLWIYFNLNNPKMEVSVRLPLIAKNINAFKFDVGPKIWRQCKFFQTVKMLERVRRTNHARYIFQRLKNGYVNSRLIVLFHVLAKISHLPILVQGETCFVDLTEIIVSPVGRAGATQNERK